MENETLGFFEKIKYLFSKPDYFFEKIKYETNIVNALLMYLSVGFVFTLISSIFYFAIFLILMPADSLGMFPIIIFLFSFLIGVIITFVYSAFIHIVVIIFSGERNYSSTYNVYTYSIIPYLMLGIIPYIGLFAIFYSLFLMIVGISKVHNISKGKAALACILPALLIIGLLIIFAISLLFMIFSY